MDTIRGNAVLAVPAGLVGVGDKSAADIYRFPDFGTLVKLSLEEVYPKLLPAGYGMPLQTDLRGSQLHLLSPEELEHF
jgi:hypothetical protein